MSNSVDIVNYTKGCIENYKIFCGLKSFPSIDVYPLTLSYDKAQSLGYGVLADHHFDLETKQHTIRISEQLYKYGVQAEYILFHEFTHVCDVNEYVNTKVENVAIKGYTEYHASQIEMLRILNWKSVNDRNAFSLSQSVNQFLISGTVFNYLMNSKATAEKLISHDRFPQNQESLLTALSFIFNHIGRLSICKLYCTDYADYHIEFESSKIISCFLRNNIYEMLLGFLLKWPTKEEIVMLNDGFLRIALGMFKEYSL